MENAQHKNPQQALRSFDGRLAAGVEALKSSGRWDSILQAGGSSREMLGRPSPPVQVSPCLACKHTTSTAFRMLPRQRGSLQRVTAIFRTTHRLQFPPVQVLLCPMCQHLSPPLACLCMSGKPCPRESTLAQDICDTTSWTESKLYLTTNIVIASNANCSMQAHSQAGEEGRQASNAPVSQREDSSLQSGAFSEAQPLMNGQADSNRHLEHGAGEESLQPSRDDTAMESGSSGEMSVGDQELLGQQTLDFWLNLCIGHTLIVEQDENGGPSVFQVQRLPHSSSV